MPDLDLDAIAERKPLTIADNGLAPDQVIFLDTNERDALVARVRELEETLQYYARFSPPRGFRARDVLGMKQDAQGKE